MAIFLSIFVITIGALATALESALMARRFATPASEDGALSEDGLFRRLCVLKVCAASAFAFFGVTTGFEAEHQERYQDALVGAIAGTIISTCFLVLLSRRLASAYPDNTIKICGFILMPFMLALGPVVQFGDIAVRGMLRLFKLNGEADVSVTQEEIKNIIEQGMESGVLHPTEEKIVTKVFRLGDRNVDAFMTPRKDVVWLDLADPLDHNWEIAAESGFSYFPVCDGSIDSIRGIASIKDVASSKIRGNIQLEPSAIRDALKVPGAMPALTLLEQFRTEKKHMALVIDEYGGIDGLITTHDLMEAMVGELGDENLVTENSIAKRHDGSFLVDASIDLEELMDFLEVDDPAQGERKGYYSLGGMVMGHLGHVPAPGDSFEYLGLRFEVVDMDGNRIDKVLVSVSAYA